VPQADGFSPDTVVRGNEKIFVCVRLRGSAANFFLRAQRAVNLVKEEAMSQGLKEGMTFEFSYAVPVEKTVPHLFPEFSEGGKMPEVLATGFLVGLLEFACIKFINPHIDWPRQQTVGIQISLSHTAATPPGFTVTIKGRLEKVDGRKLAFGLEAGDGVDSICKATHERFIIDADKFNAAVDRKRTAK
jgi:fluoroacetyl-CoA thioesterase